MKTPPRSAVLLAISALLAGCDPGGGGGTQAQATPGPLTVSLEAPVAGDRALVIAITGPGAVTDVQPAVAGYVIHTRTQGAATKVAVFGTIAAGPVLRFSVSDTRQTYQAAVVDGADGANTARTNLAAYKLTVVR